MDEQVLMRQQQESNINVMGEEDYMFLPPVKNIVKNHKLAYLEIIEDCGHVCNVEKPEIFNEVSINFLKKYSGA